MQSRIRRRIKTKLSSPSRAVHMSLIFTVFSTVTFICASFSTLDAKTNKERTFQIDDLKKMHCPTNSARNLNPTPDYTEKILDAGMFVGIYQKQEKNITAKQMNHLGKSQASKLRHLSFVTADCDERNTLVVSFPSPLPLKKGNISGVQKALERHCKSHKVESVSGESLSLRDLISNRKKFISASVVCLPKTPSWAGPREWFLVKGMKEDKTSDSLPTIYKKIGIDESSAPVNIAAVLKLINELRAISGLAVTRPHSSLTKMANRLTRSKSLEHNTKRVAALSEIAKEDIPSLKKVAETRVMSSTLGGLARLVLTSPGHRNMILDKHATLSGIHTRKIGRSYLTVIVYGYQKSGKDISHSTRKRTSSGEGSPRKM